MKIEGTTALVTGASRRIGRALALSLADNGCNVAVHYHRSEADALETRDRVRELGMIGEAIPADLADSDECDRLWTETVRIVGEVPRIVINNASLFRRVNLRDASAGDFDRAMAVNVRAPMLLAQSMDRDLPEDAGGKIFNINDHRTVYRSRFTYAVTNAALTGLTKALAVSLAPRVQVNEIRLGAILPTADDRSLDPESYSSRTLGPARRLGTLEEVCQAVISIIGNDYINGASLSVDGGLSAID